jgi:hypothetical protein
MDQKINKISGMAKHMIFYNSLKKKKYKVIFCIIYYESNIYPSSKSLEKIHRLISKIINNTYKYLYIKNAFVIFFTREMNGLACYSADGVRYAAWLFGGMDS